MRHFIIGASALAIALAGCQRADPATTSAPEPVAETSVMLQCDGATNSNYSTNGADRKTYRIDLVSKTLSEWYPRTSTWGLHEGITEEFSPQRMAFSRVVTRGDMVMNFRFDFDRQLGTVVSTFEATIFREDAAAIRDRTTFEGTCKKVAEPDTSTVF